MSRLRNIHTACIHISHNLIRIPPVIEEHKAASKQLVKLIEDNGLDVIHQEPVEEEKPVSDIVGGMASFELKVTLQEDYPNYVTVGLEGLGDDIEVYKEIKLS